MRKVFLYHETNLNFKISIAYRPYSARMFTFLSMNCKKLLTLLLAIAAAVSVSAQLPSIELKNLEGKIVNVSTLSNDGKPFVISFFADWCHPCKRELRAINEVYADWQDETGMKLIAVSEDEAHNMSKVRPTVESEGWEYDVLLDPNGEFMRAMGVQAIPHVFVFDGKGKMVYSHSGYTEGSEQAIIEKIREILANE